MLVLCIFAQLPLCAFHVVLSFCLIVICSCGVSPVSSTQCMIGHSGTFPVFVYKWLCAPYVT